MVCCDSNHLAYLGMARLKLTARPVGSKGVEPSEEERRQLSEGEEDLSNVVTDPSELMGSREKPPPTLIFGQSWATQDLVESYEQKGYFGPGVCRAPEGEITPDPRDRECVVFWDFFAAVLRFPLDPAFPKILARFGLRMHHLTPQCNRAAVQVRLGGQDLRGPSEHGCLLQALRNASARSEDFF